ncbi:MAG: DUF167 family protein [Elusimicrobiota bacterium]|nr:DUF167 family protein [Elusimicrobiota bacterium]
MTAQAALIRLKVHPGSRAERLERRGPDAYELWVKAPAERGLANAAALALLARELGCPPKSLFLVKGATSPSKIVRRLGT